MTGARKTILVVDDDPGFRSLVRHVLEDEYEIVEAGHPTAALSLALEKSPDCILLDLDLPDVSGVELCTILADMNATKLIPVIVITGHLEARIEQISKLIRIAGYIEKPFDLRKLKEGIAAAVGTKQGERRGEARVRLPITVRIVGTDAAGKRLDTVIVTHDVSANGFSSSTDLALPVGNSLEAWVTAGKKPAKGEALVVRVEKRGTPAPLYGFQFIQKPENWILR